MGKVKDELDASERKSIEEERKEEMEMLMQE